MDIKVLDENNKKVVKLIGDLDGNSSEETTEKVLSIIDDGCSCVLDMTDCPYVSSAGLRSLLTIGKTLKMKNGSMQFLNLCDEVNDVMEMTGFATIFKNFEE